MKKYFLAIAAIVIAVGFSAFTNVKTEKEPGELTSYYFLITDDYNLGAIVQPEDAVFIGEEDPGSMECEGLNKQCISIFNENQVDGTELDGPQQPASTPYEKS